MSNINALVLFSGGLDSMLAVKLLQNQGVAVTAITFKSAFWEITKAEASAASLGIPLIVHDFSRDHLAMVKKPRYGYGAAANPCLDCHLLMLRFAHRYLKSGKINQNTLGVYMIPPPGWTRLTPKVKPPFFDFVATGEVLGQRPFSQHQRALSTLAKESGLDSLLLRPLSAKLLPETLPEKKGWVNREKLEAIQGRSRSRQIALAKKFGITRYPQPAGGCLLCERIFGTKLKEMFARWPDCTVDDVQLLRLGRHFWEDQILIVLGRNQAENEKLVEVKKKKDVLIIPDTPGPTALIRGKKISEEVQTQAEKLIDRYTKKASMS